MIYTWDHLVTNPSVHGTSSFTVRRLPILQVAARLTGLLQLSKQTAWYPALSRRSFAFEHQREYPLARQQLCRHPDSPPQSALPSEQDQSESCPNCSATDNIVQRRLRQTFYAEHYYPDWTEEEREHDRAHNCASTLIPHPNFDLLSLKNSHVQYTAWSRSGRQ